MWGVYRRTGHERIQVIKIKPIMDANDIGEKRRLDTIFYITKKDLSRSIGGRFVENQSARLITSRYRPDVAL